MAKSLTGRNMSRDEVQDRDYLPIIGLKSLKLYSKKERQHRLKTYFKFLVARNPLERLLSAYYSKFGGPHGIQQGFSVHAPYIRNHSKGELSFANFIEYLTEIYDVASVYFSSKSQKDDLHTWKIDEKTKSNILGKLTKNHVLPRGSRYFEQHWAQYSTLCHPCHVDYDYIVKFETMREDAAYVLSKLGPHDQCLEDKYTELYAVSERSSSRTNQFYSNLSSLQILKVEEMYRIDFNLFGYDELR